jgi:hypothetical protein
VALWATGRVQLEGQVVEAQISVQIPGQQHDLEIGDRVLVPQNLDVKLGVLTVPASLWLLVAKDRTERVELDRLGTDVHPVFDVGTYHTSGELGPQRDLAASLVGEGVHLLVHDIGALTDPTGKELGHLEHGHVYALKAVQFCQVTRSGTDMVPVSLVFRQNVESSLWPLIARHRTAPPVRRCPLL